MQRFVLKPRFNNLSEYQLQYKDLFTYITIRSFYNTKDKYCFPSYDTLSKRSGLSKKFISESIKRLECAGFLDIWKIIKVRTQHCYKFHHEGTHFKIPFQIFEMTDLSSNEASMLLLLHEHCNSVYECAKSVSEIAECSGATYRTIKSQLKSLLLKGYVIELERENLKDKTIEKVLKLSDRINWNLPGPNSITIEQAKSKTETFDVDAVVKMVRKATKMGTK